jgi:RNA polymerase sigma-70 factor (ECF subfamily)
MVRRVDFHGVLQAARQREPWAWTELYDTFAPKLLGYLRARRVDAAEDVVSDTFVELVRALDSFEGDEAQFQAWLFRIAGNRLVDELRRRARRAAGDSLVPAERSAPDCADATIEAEADARIAGLLGVLPDDQRATVYLRTIVGMSFADVATSMGRSTGSVKMLHGRAMRTLGARFAPVVDPTVTNSSPEALEQ